MLEKKEKKLFDEEMTRRQFLKISGKGLAGLTLSASMLQLFGCTSGQVNQGQVATWTTPKGLLVVNAAVCTDCQRCETNCTIVNDGVASSRNARIKMTRNLMTNKNGKGMMSELSGHWTSFPDTCRQCSVPACGNACPVGAIYADPNGVKLVDTKKCVACGACVRACPWQMPTINTVSGKMSKCIACGECVAGCPSGALKIVPWTEVAAVAQASWGG